MVGSLAAGDFDADSDVDFLVVTKTGLSAANRQALQVIHTKMHAIDCYPAKHLEGSYISLQDLNDWGNVGKTELFYFDNGSTTPELSTHDNQWHVRWVLRERGIRLTGPGPETLLPVIPSQALKDEMKTSMLKVLQYFRGEMNAPLSFGNSRFGQPFYILTICRMLQTLHTGSVQSKKAGAEWAKTSLDPNGPI